MTWWIINVSIGISKRDEFWTEFLVVNLYLTGNENIANVLNNYFSNIGGKVVQHIKYVDAMKLYSIDYSKD